MAKVSKIDKTIRGVKHHNLWIIDARSIGHGRIFENPETGERFKSKKEAQEHLHELESPVAVDFMTKETLKVHDLCYQGEKKIPDGSNSRKKTIINGGRYIMSRLNDADNERIRKRFVHENVYNTLRVFNVVNKAIYWKDIDAKQVAEDLLAHRKKHAHKKETRDLQDASAWTSFLKDISILKTMSSWVAEGEWSKNPEENLSPNVFARVQTQQKKVRKSGFVKPDRLKSLQKKSKDSSVDMKRVETIREWMCENYQKHDLDLENGRGLNKRNTAFYRKNNILLQFDLLLITGLRINELLALTWDDISYREENGTRYIALRINKAFLPYDDRVDLPKYVKGGDRANYIYIHEGFIPILKQHKLSQNLMQSKNNLIFPSTVGSIETVGTLGRQMKKANEDLYPDEVSMHITPHTLRHAMATETVRNEGEDGMASLSKKLRHKSGVAFTKKAYVHLIEERKENQVKEALASAQLPKLGA